MGPRADWVSLLNLYQPFIDAWLSDFTVSVDSSSRLCSAFLTLGDAMAMTIVATRATNRKTNAPKFPARRLTSSVEITDASQEDGAAITT